MMESPTDRRLAENEVLFRQHNQQIEQGFQELKAIAKAEGQLATLSETDRPLHFYCECSNASCRKRIVMKPSEYAKLHTNRTRFVVLPHHEIPEIERVVLRKSTYLVVEKYLTPPLKATKLHATNKKKPE